MAAVAVATEPMYVAGSHRMAGGLHEPPSTGRSVYKLPPCTLTSRCSSTSPNTSAGSTSRNVSSVSGAGAGSTAAAGFREPARGVGLPRPA